MVRPYPSTALTAHRWMERAGNGMGACSLPTPPRKIREFIRARSIWKLGRGRRHTIRQGLRVGVSAYRGPYLNRQSWYFPWGRGEPKQTARARPVGLDARGYGHWTVQGEWQGFVLPYTVIPTDREKAGYGELKRVLSPRWYVAARNGNSPPKHPGTSSVLRQRQASAPAGSNSLKSAMSLSITAQALSAMKTRWGSNSSLRSMWPKHCTSVM